MMRALSLALLFCFTLPALAQSPSPTKEGKEPKINLDEQNEQIARQAVFDYLAKSMILVSDGTVTDEGIEFEAEVANRHCTVVLEHNKTAKGRWLVKNMNCTN